MRVRLRNGYKQAYAQIMQHTHTHKAVTGHVEAKKLLSRQRQSNYRPMKAHDYNGVTPVGSNWVILEAHVLSGLYASSSTSLKALKLPNCFAQWENPLFRTGLTWLVSCSIVANCYTSLEMCSSFVPYTGVCKCTKKQVVQANFANIFLCQRMGQRHPGPSFATFL